MAREIQLDIQEKTSDLAEVHINAWICENQILRVELHQFVPEKFQ